MPRIEQNGPDFKYIISWKRMDVPGAVEEVENVQRSDAWHYVVPERQETYKPFEIRVKAANAKGDSSVEPIMVIGYSGEAEPRTQVNDATVDPDSITSTEAILQWTQVDTDPDVIRGFFRGYRVSGGDTHYIRGYRVSGGDTHYIRGYRVSGEDPHYIKGGGY